MSLSEKFIMHIIFNVDFKFYKHAPVWYKIIQQITGFDDYEVHVM